MSKPNLVLIGFMGTGKTRIGKLCAKALDYKFQDTDALIEQRMGRSVAEIFAEDGEVAFRAIERDTIAELAAGTGQVISTGGGAALFEANVERLRETGTIVWLTAHPKILLVRVGGKNAYKRPLLASAADPLARIKEMLAERDPYYRDAADFVVASERRRPNEVTSEIISRYRAFGISG